MGQHRKAYHLKWTQFVVLIDWFHFWLLFIIVSTHSHYDNREQHVVFYMLYLQEIVVGSNMDKIYIVMDYVEHDLKSLMETMKQPFTIG